MLSCGRLSDPETAAEKNELQEPNGQQVLLSITLRTFMLQCEGQSFKCIFLSISTMCRGWLQEGGMGFGTDLAVSAVSFLLRVSLTAMAGKCKGGSDFRGVYPWPDWKQANGSSALHVSFAHITPP